MQKVILIIINKIKYNLLSSNILGHIKLRARCPMLHNLKSYLIHFDSYNGIDV